MGDIIKFKQVNKPKKEKDNNVCKIVCKILEDLQGKTAEQILDIYAKGIEPPIDIEGLVKKIGIFLRPMDFTEVEKKTGVKIGDILGATIAVGEKVDIYYRINATENRKRFTIAHEIAHCCLHTEKLMTYHVEFRKDNDEIADERERDANIFAGELLIPETKLREVHKKLLLPSLSALSEIFQVSSNVMAARLNYLKISYYPDMRITEV